jgi:WD40 repeat protein
VCPVTVNGQALLASGGGDRTVRIWDPATGELVTALQGHQGVIRSVCPVTVNGQVLLASAGEDRTVRIWDPATSAPLITIPASYQVLSIHEVATLLAIGLGVGILVIKLNI